MIKGGILLLLVLGTFLFFPTVLAEEEGIQEQWQNYSYSGFNRFVDNVKMFFSFGDNKVMLALEIREKEVNSALSKVQNGNDEDAIKGLERARERLQLIQEKVSANAAEAVEKNIEKFAVQLSEKGNISEDFELYKLEEEKTKLVAKLVIEVNGSEGQTLKREVIKNKSSGVNNVVVIVEGNNGTEGQTKTREIVGDIGEINNQIAERVVKIDMAEGASKMEKGESVYIAKSDGEGDDGLNPEVKTTINEGGVNKEEPLPEPNLNEINPDLYDPDARAPGDTMDETYDDNLIEDGDCGDGVDCGDGSADPGTEGTNYIAPAVDSNEGD
jgi:hypothetical protein